MAAEFIGEFVDALIRRCVVKRRRESREVGGRVATARLLLYENL
jgi:hypothetical protein